MSQRVVCPMKIARDPFLIKNTRDRAGANDRS